MKSNEQLNTTNRSSQWQPLISQPHDAKHAQQLQRLFKDNSVRVVDGLPEAVEDLFKIRFPFIAAGSPEYSATLEEFKKRYYQGFSEQTIGVWVYFPWRNTLVHLPDEDDYFALRTARNKFLITQKEQETFYAALIGVAGLSVGSSVVNSITLSGGGGKMRIADNDSLAITNLNRLYASVCDVGLSKADIAARRIFEINPFQKLEMFDEGLTAANMENFFTHGGQKLDLFIEEMDNIKLKIDSRFMARRLKVPVIMATDNGDNAIIDVERFDLEPERPLFHGLVKESILKNVPDNPSLSERVKLASSIVGLNITPRTKKSLMLVGTTIPAWPQLGNAATLSGVAASFVARKILVGDTMPSGRYEVDLDQSLDTMFKTQQAQNDRRRETAFYVEGLKALFGE